MAAHSSIPAWIIPWTEEPGGLQSTGEQELDTTERLNHTATAPGRTQIRWQCVPLGETASGSPFGGLRP